MKHPNLLALLAEGRDLFRKYQAHHEAKASEQGRPEKALVNKAIADKYDEALAGFTFGMGELVTKTKGSSWTGKVVGFYSTELTPEGYAVESINEPGSVQIYPVAALRSLEAS